MTWSFVLLMIFIRSSSIWTGNSRDLSAFGIKSYQIINAIDDQTEFYRAKRSTVEEISDRLLTFQLNSKNITLFLKNVRNFFAVDADIHLDSSNYLPIDSSILYEGFLIESPNTSFVTGGFYSNSFDGIIKTSNETWYIEPIRKYGISSTHFNSSIIYNSLDVDFDRYDQSQTIRYKRFFPDQENFCGVNDEKIRPKRQSKIDSADERTCCYLYIRIDPTLWSLVYRNEGLYEKQATIHALVTFLYRTITAANSIYRPLKFESNNDFLYRFTLRIKRIRILTPDDCREQNLTLSETNLCRPFLDSNILLTWHSAENFSDYCLAYLFSARDFGDGTLGLAWIGTVSSNSRGGICEKPARDIYEGQRVIKTLNTGIITVINHNARVSPLMAELAFTHEVGHSLGAEHDDDQCSNDKKNGYFIMYRRATTGLEHNNNLFSNCSREKMGVIVLAVKNELLGKRNCFAECSQVGFCGNRNVEDNEECDCGFVSECTDQCCYPADGSDSKLACQLKANAQCSPSKGPCCSDQCTFHSSTHLCHKDQEDQHCIGDVRCDGVRATCPLNDSRFFKPIDTPCNHYTALCDRGECNKSVCTLIGKFECQLTIANVTEPLRQRAIDREYFCHIGCLNTTTNTCIDSLALQMVNNRSPTGFGYRYRAGHACAGTTGYCDVFGKCRLVDAEGPLTRLKNKFLNEENIRTLNEVARDYWWILLLGFFGFLGFLSIFVKLCSVHTPSSNPFDREGDSYNQRSAIRSIEDDTLLEQQPNRSISTRKKKKKISRL